MSRRWRWAGQVGLLSLRFVPQQQCNGHWLCDSAQARAVHKSLGNRPIHSPAPFPLLSGGITIERRPQEGLWTSLKQRGLGLIPLRLSFFFKKVVVCGRSLVTLSLTINETLKWLSSLPILMQESFWWWQCSNRYILSLFPHLHTLSPFSAPFLISLMVSVEG